MKLLPLPFVSSLTPEELMERVKQQGDRRAFKGLFDHFKGPVRGYCRRILKDEALADEASQEVFLKIYRFREQYQSGASFIAWLWTIARNTALDVIRKKEDQSHLREIHLGESREETPIDMLPDAALPADESLIRAVQTRHLQECLERLPQPQRDIVALRIFSELEYEEICRIHALSLPALKSLLHRAKNSVQKCLQERYV